MIEEAASNEVFICCACNKPVDQPHCKLVCPKLHKGFESILKCPFSLDAKWVRRLKDKSGGEPAIPQQPLCADGASPKLPSDIIDLLTRCRECLHPYYPGATLLMEDLDHIIGNFTKR